MMWLPEHGVGAVVLTNGDPGWLVLDSFRRKLLEVLFDGQPTADAELASDADAWFQGLATARTELTVPLPAELAGTLATRYHSDALGDFAIATGADGKTVLDVGEFKSEVASKTNPDGTMSIVTIAPGLSGIELVIGSAGDKRTLTLRDAQHEYVITEM
jgi:hypothetical protein